MVSVSALNWTFLPNASAVKVGDLVSADAGGMPIYEVMAIEEGRAWLRREETSQALEMSLDRFSWKVAGNA